jgi:hypothetical protein
MIHHDFTMISLAQDSQAVLQAATERSRVGNTLGGLSQVLGAVGQEALKKEHFFQDVI